jgi:hypothetical protein
MRLIRASVVLVIATLIGIGCGSSVGRAQKGSYKAQENVANERLELVGKYQQCVDKAGEDQQKVEACDSYLKAAEALK